MAYIAYTKGKEPKKRIPIEDAVREGRIETSELERMGFKGRGGFLGRGVYGSGNRKPGYRRQG